jgi:hypothetical protein
VVFHRRDEHLVALVEMGPGVGLGHQVDGLGGAAGEDDLLGVGGVDEAMDFGSGALVGLGRPLGEVVHAAVHVGVVPRVEPRHRVDHRLWLLAGGGAVEVDEGLAVGLLVEDGELLAHALDVE